MGQMVDGMQWDPSVKALIAFPSVLANLNKNWTGPAQLGNAYYNQPTGCDVGRAGDAAASL